MAKKTKIFTIITVITLIAIGIITFLFSNKTEVYSIGGYKYFGEVINHMKNVYCLDHGWTYARGDYEITDSGNLADIANGPALAYLVAKYGQDVRDATYDPVANAIWKYYAHCSYESSVEAEADRIWKEALEATNVQPGRGGNVSISGLDSSTNFVPEDSAGQLGPFSLNYPTANGQPIGKVTIKINGQEMSTPPSGSQFYLNEGNGIKFGEENHIEVHYEGTIYGGTYAEYSPAPYVVATETRICRSCGSAFTYEGMFHGNYQLPAPGSAPGVELELIAGQHKETCEDETKFFSTGVMYEWFSGWLNGNQYGPIAYADNNPNVIQGLIEINPTQQPISENLDFNFWAGKPDIEINLDKINMKNTNISGAEFNVTVNNGKLESSSSVSASNGTNPEVMIKPDRGASTVTVTLHETKAPNDFTEIKNDIVVTYTWDSTSKQWKSSVSRNRFR